MVGAMEERAQGKILSGAWIHRSWGPSSPRRPRRYRIDSHRLPTAESRRRRRSSMRTVPAAVLTIAIFLWRSSLVAEDAPPWRPHRPIVLVRKELYRERPRPGAAALVSQSYVGPGLERLETQALEVRDDVPSEGRQRRSSDNGRTWSAFEDLPPTLHTL